LAALFRDKSKPEPDRFLATNILISYAGDRPETMVSLLLDAEPKSFLVLFDALKVHDQSAVSLLTSAIEKEKERTPQQRGRAAVALVRLGQGDKVWPLLRHSADPSTRSYIVNWLQPLGADPKTIATKLAALR